MSKILFAMTSLAFSGMCFAPPDSGGGDVDAAREQEAADRKKRIHAAIEGLDHKIDTDWTQAGLPSVDRVRTVSGFADVTRQDIADAHPGYARQTDTDAGKTGDGGEGDKGGTEMSELEKAKQLTKPNSSPEENENVGKDLGPYEGQAHTADQEQNLEAQLGTEDGKRGAPTAQEIGEHFKDPVLLIEAAVAAMNGSDRYRKNGELQTFLRDYSIRQVNIKAHQGRLDKRWAEAEKQAG